MMPTALRHEIPLVALLGMAVALVALPGSGRAAEQSPFLLQEHGGVRIIRGLSEEKNFETAELPPEEEEEALPAPAQPPVTPPRQMPVRGLITHRAGDDSQQIDRLRDGAIRGNSIVTHGTPGLSGGIQGNIVTHGPRGLSGTGRGNIVTHGPKGLSRTSRSKNIVTHGPKGLNRSSRRNTIVTHSAQRL